MGLVQLVRRSSGLGRVLGAQAVSALGDAMAVTALILHVQRTTGSAVSVGLLLFVQAVPPVVAPLAGALADRVRPDRLVAVGLVMQSFLVAPLAIGLPPLLPLLVVVFLLALVDVPLQAAIGSGMPAMVADADLPAANGWRVGARELGTVVGPPLAGLLFAVSGPRLVLALDALTFLAAVPLVLRLPRAERPAGAPGVHRRSLRADVAEGIGFVWRTPTVRAVAVGFWIVVLFTSSDDLILPFLATGTFGGGPLAVGFLLAAASVGLLLGLSGLDRAGRRLGPERPDRAEGTGPARAVVVGFGVMAVGNLLTAAAPWIGLAFASQVLRGAAIPLADASVTTHLQRTAPPGLLGRALANVYGGVSIAAAAGYLLGGIVVELTSPRFAFMVVGAGGVLGTAVTMALLRRLGGRSAG